MSSHAIAGVHVGRPSTVTDEQGRTFESAIVKTAVTEPVTLSRTHLAGDEQADQDNHGGPDQALCVYATCHLPHWRTALGRDDLGLGAFGENLSVDGIDESTAAIGDTFEIGEVVVQITQPRAPCWKLARRWGEKTFVAQVQERGATGWYLRVLQEGRLQVGQRAQLVDRPHGDLTIAEVNRGRYHDHDDLDLAARLAACDSLADGWRAHFAARLE